MAEITKVTTPLIPRENLGKNRPVTEQAFELNNPQKVNRPADDGKILDHETSGQSLREMLGRAAMAPLLRGTADVIHQIQRVITLLQMGISTSDIITDHPMRDLLSSMFVGGDQLLALLMEQDASATLFKGEAFDVLREIAARFESNPSIKGALAGALKSFEYNVNLDNSVKTILYQCENLLDYMFSKDREQFGQYLDSLEGMLLTRTQNGSVVLGEDGLPVRQELMPEAQTPYGAQFADSKLAVDPREAAGVLKNNLLPLLGEIVVKYYQSESIRDIVMVVVHNIVRVDKGTPEAMQDSIENFADVLNRFANLGDNFEKNLVAALSRASAQVKNAGNDVVEKISTVVSELLRSPETSPAALRQAENLLLGMLHNQSSMMNLLHYILPLDLGDDRVYAEMYVDPDSDESASGGREGEAGRKIFLSAESEAHGAMELCFWQTGERVELSMWCPQRLVEPLARMKKTIRDLAQVHGYTLTGFTVEELQKQHSIIQVFPKLMERKVGIDVKI